MKIPEPAPDWKNFFDLEKDVFIKLFNSSGIKELTIKANEHYHYWDKFKYYKTPEGITNELAWYYLKLIRNQQIRKLTIKDKNGKEFGYLLTDSILKELSFIDMNAGGQILSDQPDIHSSEKERYLTSSIMEEAIASSQLEGAATTRKKAKEMLRLGKKPENLPEQMILNNYKTIRDIKKIINRPLSPELILEIQSEITENTLDNPKDVGRFRDEKDEDVHVIDRRDNQVLFIPPPAEEISQRLKTLCDFANQTHEDTYIHPILKATILHFWIAYIHPFIDGNGRTARAIFYWFILKSNYWMFEYLSISRIILRAPVQYARSYLYSEIDDLDLTYFLVFNLRAVHLAIDSLRNYLAKKQLELQESHKIIRKYPDLNLRQSGLLHHAITHPDVVYTVKFLQNSYSIVHQTARTDLIELTKKGFLEKRKVGNTFYYLPVFDLSKRLKKISKTD